jgi:hypothetical protein
MLVAWQTITDALVSALEHKARLDTEEVAKTARAEARAQAQAAKAEAAAAKAAEEAAAKAAAEHAANAGKALRRVWLNISWTMEEAAYAYALEQKARSIRGWRFASIALVEALDAKKTHNAAMQFAWSNASLALYKAQRCSWCGSGCSAAPAHSPFEAWGAAYEKRRMDGIFAAMHNTGLAIGEAVDANLPRRHGRRLGRPRRRDHFAASTHFTRKRSRSLANAALAFGEAVQGLRKEAKAVHPRLPLAVAFGGGEARVRLDGYIAAWQNAAPPRTRPSSPASATKHSSKRGPTPPSSRPSTLTSATRPPSARGTPSARQSSTQSLKSPAATPRRRLVNASAAIDIAVKTARPADRPRNRLADLSGVPRGRTSPALPRNVRDGLGNVGVAMAATGNAYLFQLKSRSAWRNASRALVEAVRCTTARWR